MGDLGFMATPFIMFPLPYVKSGTIYRREVNGVKAIFSDSEGVPYTKNDRIWLESLITFIKKTGQKEMPLERVSDELAKIGRPTDGRYIASARKSIERLFHLDVYISRIVEKNNIEMYQNTRISIGDDLQLAWNKGVSNQEKQLYIPGMNFFRFSDKFLEIVKNNAVPHNREHYLEMKSAREQDLYNWLGLKLFKLEDEILIKWESLFDQFGSGKFETRDQKYKFREKIKADLYSIKLSYYPSANVETVAEGLVLKPSPPLIDPLDKKAGFHV